MHIVYASRIISEGAAHKKYINKSLLYSCTLQELFLRFLIIACIYTAPINPLKIKTSTAAM